MSSEFDPTGTTAENGEKPEYPVVDQEESIAHRRTAQRIHELMDEIAATRVRAANDLGNEYSQFQHRRAYYMTVRELWEELKPALSAGDSENEKYWWNKVDLGEYIISPPEPLTKPANRNERENRPDLLPGATWATETKHQVTGFHEFSNLSVRINHQWAIRLDDDTTNWEQLQQLIDITNPNTGYKVHKRMGRKQREPFRVSYQGVLPKHIIDNARAALRELADTVGIGLEIGKDELDRDTIAPDY